MFCKSIPFALALIPASFALPVIQWDMSNIWSWGSPGGSGSGFTISAPAGYLAGAPAFDADCWRDNGKPDGWTECRPRANHDATGVIVFRRLPQYTDPREQLKFEDMWVSHQYVYGALNVNITGHNVVDWSKDMKGSKKMPVVSKEFS